MWSPSIWTYMCPITLFMSVSTCEPIIPTWLHKLWHDNGLLHTGSFLKTSNFKLAHWYPSGLSVKRITSLCQWSPLGYSLTLQSSLNYPVTANLTVILQTIKQAIKLLRNCQFGSRKASTSPFNTGKKEYSWMRDSYIFHFHHYRGQHALTSECTLQHHHEFLTPHVIKSTSYIILQEMPVHWQQASSFVYCTYITNTF